MAITADPQAIRNQRRGLHLLQLRECSLQRDGV